LLLTEKKSKCEREYKETISKRDEVQKKRKKKKKKATKADTAAMPCT
jgi:hypothetical protein